MKFKKQPYVNADGAQEIIICIMLVPYEMTHLSYPARELGQNIGCSSV